MDRKIRVAAIGDNCIDYYDSLNESYPGGNPVNVAVYIKRLGGESSYTGAVGTDSFGKIMISAIQNKGVDTSHIQVLDGKTAVTHVDIVDGDRVFGKYEEGVLADFKLREQDISFIKKHDLAVTGIWGMIEDELPLISKEIPVAFDFANKFANPIVEKAIPYVTYGLVNYVLVNLGILDKPYNFLTQPFAAKIVIILALLWRWTGYNMVFFLSGLQNIEYSVYEAAKIDGASAIQTFFKITVPLLKPTILLTAIMSTNGTLQLFDESINLTDGGPANASISMSHYIYNLCFKYVPNFGYAAAMSFFILLLVAVLALIQMRVGDKRD